MLGLRVNDRMREKILHDVCMYFVTFTMIP